MSLEIDYRIGIVVHVAHITFMVPCPLNRSFDLINCKTTPHMYQKSNVPNEPTAGDTIGNASYANDITCVLFVIYNIQRSQKRILIIHICFKIGFTLW